MLGVSDFFEDAAVVLDGLRGREIFGCADNQHPINGENAGLTKHLAQGPGSQSSSTGGGSDAIPDVASSLVKLVAQRDAALNAPIFDYPAACTTVRFSTQTGNPCCESLERFDLISCSQSEPILVNARTPVPVRIQPSFVEINGGFDQSQRHIAMI